MSNQMKFKFFAVMLVSFLSIGSAKAVVHPITFEPGPGGWNAGFFNNDVEGSFVDVYTFTLPAGSGGDGGASVIAGFDEGFNVFISNFLFRDVTDNVTLATGTGPGFFKALSFAGSLDVTDTYALIVTGGLKPDHASGSYSGNFHISPIPEPETYAMLLAGLGLIGFSLRRRAK